MTKEQKTEKNIANKEVSVKDLNSLKRKIGVMQKQFTKALKLEAKKIGMIADVAMKISLMRDDTEGG